MRERERRREIVTHSYQSMRECGDGETLAAACCVVDEVILMLSSLMWGMCCVVCAHCTPPHITQQGSECVPLMCVWCESTIGEGRCEELIQHGSDMSVAAFRGYVKEWMK